MSRITRQGGAKEPMESGCASTSSGKAPALRRNRPTSLQLDLDPQQGTPESNLVTRAEADTARIATMHGNHLAFAQDRRAVAAALVEQPDLARRRVPA